MKRKRMILEACHEGRPAQTTHSGRRMGRPTVRDGNLDEKIAHCGVMCSSMVVGQGTEGKRAWVKP